MASCRVVVNESMHTLSFMLWVGWQSRPAGKVHETRRSNVGWANSNVFMTDQLGTLPSLIHTRLWTALLPKVVVVIIVRIWHFSYSGFSGPGNGDIGHLVDPSTTTQQLGLYRQSSRSNPSGKLGQSPDILVHATRHNHANAETLVKVPVRPATQYCTSMSLWRPSITIIGR